VSDALAIFRRTLVLFALRYCVQETFKVKLLTSRHTGLIKRRLVQRSAAAWLAHANEH
jgi:hypothetical protein